MASESCLDSDDLVDVLLEQVISQVNLLQVLPAVCTVSILIVVVSSIVCCLLQVST